MYAERHAGLTADRRVPASLHRVLSSFPTSWGSDSHNRWISSRGPGHTEMDPVQARLYALFGLDVYAPNG